jgi:hypothetical protein
VTAQHVPPYSYYLLHALQCVYVAPPALICVGANFENAILTGATFGRDAAGNWANLKVCVPAQHCAVLCWLCTCAAHAELADAPHMRTTRITTVAVWFTAGHTF